jgi:AcrR family transcriptional regulator
MITENRKKNYGRAGSAQTREALLSAGRDLFAAQGFAATTVDAIARRARVNKAMINYHFGGKRGLYTAILESVLGPINQRLAALRESPLPADQLLHEFIATFGDLVRDQPGFPAMILREAVTGGPHLEVNVLQHMSSVFQSVRLLLEKGMREGTYRPVDPLCTHLALLGGLAFFFATAPFRERMVTEGILTVPMPSTDRYLEQFETLVRRGLAATVLGGTLHREELR